jgi:tight adherence protein C
MGFAASLQLISGRFTGPMGAELKLMQREQGLGISNEQALENLVHRCDTPSVRAFSRSLLHGQELGVSIGPILRNLAIDIRRRRRQTAREKVQKAPIKMLFPLALLIFPPLVIVILYPAIYNILHALSGS